METAGPDFSEDQNVGVEGAHGLAFTQDVEHLVPVEHVDTRQFRRIPTFEFESVVQPLASTVRWQPAERRRTVFNGKCCPGFEALPGSTGSACSPSHRVAGAGKTGAAGSQVAVAGSGLRGADPEGVELAVGQVKSEADGTAGQSGEIGSLFPNDPAEGAVSRHRQAVLPGKGGNGDALRLSQGPRLAAAPVAPAG